MPVSNISVVGVRSVTAGASRWIGQRSWTSIGSPSSMTSPSRLKMRPSVTSPTGTLIGPPVSTTSAPRDRPSVVSIATARTRSSPRCCCTSHTRMPASPRSTVMALLISGSSSGKAASMTTPWISSIRPVFCLVSVAASIASGLSGFRSFVLPSPQAAMAGRRHLHQRLGAGDNFHDLLGDLGLAGAVHLEREVVDDLRGVLRGVAHGGHARPQLGRRRLEQRPVERDLDVVGDETLEDLLGARLVLDERVVPGVLAVVLALGRLEDGRLLQRQQRLAPHPLPPGRDVAVVEEVSQ